MKIRVRILIPVLLGLGFFRFESLSQSERGQILQDSLLITMDRSAILDIYAIFDLPEFLFPIDYEAIEIHKVVYRTLSPLGDSFTIASGLITVPLSGLCDFPLLSYQHGTLPYDSVVSDLNARFNQHYFGVPFAANGYVTVIPDYLGLGTTHLEHHPFNHAESEAYAVIDLLRAAKDFCEAHEVHLNDQLFLVGYSQGGHATMAAHREMERMHQDQFTVTASAPGGGAYDLSGISRDSMLFSPNFSNPFFIGYAIISWQYIYGDIYIDFSEVFVPPYDSMLLRIFNREHPQAHWIDSLPRPGTLLLDTNFLQSVKTDTLHPLNIYLRENNVYDWVPEAPVRLFYCEDDETVPPANTLFTYDRLVQSGAEVYLYNGGPGFTHATCTAPAVIAAKLWFDELREGCSTTFAEVEPPATLLYPNPFTSTLYIASPESLQQIYIYDLDGRLIKAIDMRSTLNSLNLPGLRPGTYFCEMVAGDSRLHQLMTKI